jgi:hypothetical protein
VYETWPDFRRPHVRRVAVAVSAVLLQQRYSVE